jgi:hypothetical protein
MLLKTIAFHQPFTLTELATSCWHVAVRAHVKMAKGNLNFITQLFHVINLP